MILEKYLKEALFMNSFLTKIIGTIIFTASLLHATLSFAETEVVEKARDLFDKGDNAKVEFALEYFKKRKNLDSVGVLILAMRFSPSSHAVADVLDLARAQFSNKTF